MSDDDVRFTKEQHDALLEMLEQQQKVDWFWKSCRTWAGYIAAAITFTFAAYKFLTDYLWKVH